VAPNKFLAKIASGWRKPDGLTVIPPERVEAFLAELPVDALWGVGPVTARKLRSVGIERLLDVRAGKFPYNDLVALAESRIATIEHLFAHSSLPDHPDLDAINRTVISIRRQWYRIPATQPCGNAFAD
jgi:hypothetical protein